MTSSKPYSQKKIEKKENSKFEGRKQNGYLLLPFPIHAISYLLWSKKDIWLLFFLCSFFSKRFQELFQHSQKQLSFQCLKTKWFTSGKNCRAFNNKTVDFLLVEFVEKLGFWESFFNPLLNAFPLWVDNIKIFW